MARLFQKISMIFLLFAFSVSCTEKFDFNYEDQTDIFKQNAVEVSKKVDILWVIDNSYSMFVHQEALANNFKHFISEFKTKGFDYRIAVTTSEAFENMYLETDWYKDRGADKALLADGNVDDGPSGFVVIDNNTPNIDEVFQKNIMQGVLGNGDERSLQSIRATLSDKRNLGFRRPGAFLSVIVVSDEEDFSRESEIDLRASKHNITELDYQHDLSVLDPIYADPEIEDIQLTIDFLADLTEVPGSEEVMNFSVSSIVVDSQECHEQFAQDQFWGGQLYGKRLVQIAKETNGVVASLCDDFADSLTKVSGKILELTTRFPLSRKADPETLKVFVDDKLMDNSASNGWTYNAIDNLISFHGNAVPADGAKIAVKFTPVEGI